MLKRKKRSQVSFLYYILLIQDDTAFTGNATDEPELDTGQNADQDVTKKVIIISFVEFIFGLTKHTH